MDIRALLHDFDGLHLHPFLQGFLLGTSRNLRLTRPSGCGSITNVITKRGGMMFSLKLTQIGNSVGVILPKDVLARLKVGKGSSVFITETPDGYVLTPYDPNLAEQVQAGRELMREYRDTFHQLAK